MDLGRMLASVGLVVVGVVAAASLRAGTPVPPPPPPATPSGLRALAEELDDTAAFIDQLIAQKINCAGSLAWHGETITVREKMRRTCGTPDRAWDQGQHLWSKSQQWLTKTGAIDTCGDTGTLPNKGDGYCTQCPAPYDVTAQALRDDAESLRKMAAAVDCGVGVVAAAGAEQTKQDGANDKKKKDDADDKIKADADAKQKSQADQDAAKKTADADATQKGEEAKAKEQEKEEQRQKDVSDQYAQEKQSADETNATQGDAMGGMASTAASAHGGETSGVTGVSYGLHLSVGLGIGSIPLYADTDQTKDVTAHSSTTVAIGMGPSFEFGFWPLVSPYVSVGVVGTAVMGGFALPGGGNYFFSGMGTARVMAGRETKVSALGRAGYGKRIAGTSSDSGGGIISARSVGSFSQNLGELGAGVHFCLTPQQKSDEPAKRGLSEDYCDTGLQLWVLFHSSSTFDAGGTPMAIEADLFSHGSYGADLQLWHDYPRGNAPSYPGGASNSGGPLVLLSVRLITMDDFSLWKHASSAAPSSPTRAIPPK